MTEKSQLQHPWLVAAWPGMGQVALNAGVYLLAKLDMSLFAELDAGGLFDVDHVEVQGGIIQAGRRPRNRFFVREDPGLKHDLVVFLGEAQPPLGKSSLCRQIIEFAKGEGVERVVTFAAMATAMHPEHPSHVFAAATDAATLEELKPHGVEILEDGHIGGLNGILLGAAAEAGLPGVCLLGEMPHIFRQLAFPKASLAILRTFAALTGLDVDFHELAEQARASEEQLGELLARVEQAYGRPGEEPEEEEAPSGLAEPAEPQRPGTADRQHIEGLFTQAAGDRTRAFELKQELDRLGLFKDYEDRFLDLFKKPG